MVAYFSSRFTKQIQATLAVALLMVCMLGTHWVGFAHSISHATVQQQTIGQATPDEIAPIFTHGSDVCHLFDALTLAGFIPDTSTKVTAVPVAKSFVELSHQITFTELSPAAYLSRAPPTFIL